MVLCQALYNWRTEWIEMHEKLEEVCENVGVKKVEQKVGGLGKVARRKTQEDPFFPAEDGQVKSSLWLKISIA